MSSPPDGRVKQILQICTKFSLVIVLEGKTHVDVFEHVNLKVKEHVEMSDGVRGSDGKVEKCLRTEEIKTRGKAGRRETER